jgi:translation initiation factor 2 beta subunit (eIF-2beta)/eIF-5
MTMSAFDDEFQRRMDMEERLQKSLAFDDTARRALQQFDVGRQLRELAERHSLATTKIRDLLDRSQFDQIAQQLARTFGEGGAFQTATERLLQIDAFRNVDRCANLRLAGQTIRDRIAAALERYNRNFFVPETGAIAQLAEKLALLEPLWPAPGSEDTELGVFMGPEVRHGEAEVYTRVQA